MRCKVVANSKNILLFPDLSSDDFVIFSLILLLEPFVNGFDCVHIQQVDKTHYCNPRLIMTCKVGNHISCYLVL